MRQAEALLRGEPIERTAEREEEVPGATERAQLLCRCIIGDLDRLSEDDLDALRDYIRRKYEGRVPRKPRRRQPKARAMPAQKAGPFRVIEGGCAQ